MADRLCGLVFPQLQYSKLQDNHGLLIVGNYGTGILSVTNGGTVTGLSALGYQPGASGTVTLDGGGSKCTNAGDLTWHIAVSEQYFMTGVIEGEFPADGAVIHRL